MEDRPIDPLHGLNQREVQSREVELKRKEMKRVKRRG